MILSIAILLLAQTAVGVEDASTVQDKTVTEALELVEGESTASEGTVVEIAKSPESADEESANTDKKEKKDKKPRPVKITSIRTDYDRMAGVILFDGTVFVDDTEYKMHSDQLYVFLDGTNELKRIVAIGNVAITNELRSGTCAKATYSKPTGKVVMYGDGAETYARLVDNGKKKSELLGRKITFWTDTEQVEVEGSVVKMEAGSVGDAKKLLGK